MASFFPSFFCWRSSPLFFCPPRVSSKILRREGDERGRSRPARRIDSSRQAGGQVERERERERAGVRPPTDRRGVQDAIGCPRVDRRKRRRRSRWGSARGREESAQINVEMQTEGGREREGGPCVQCICCWLLPFDYDYVTFVRPHQLARNEGEAVRSYGVRMYDGSYSSCSYYSQIRARTVRPRV